MLGIFWTVPVPTVGIERNADVSPVTTLTDLARCRCGVTDPITPSTSRLRATRRDRARGSGLDSRGCRCRSPSEGLKLATRWGKWEPVKNLANKSSAFDLKCAPHPRALGKLQSSYRGATPTQNSPRNKCEQAWKQTRENSTRTSTV